MWRDLRTRKSNCARAKRWRESTAGRAEVVVRLTLRQAEVVLAALRRGEWQRQAEQSAMTPRQTRAEASVTKAAERRLATALTRAHDVEKP
jgi:hypothetical protein